MRCSPNDYLKACEIIDFRTPQVMDVARGLAAPEPATTKAPTPSQIFVLVFIDRSTRHHRAGMPQTVAAIVPWRNPATRSV